MFMTRQEKGRRQIKPKILKPKTKGVIKINDLFLEVPTIPYNWQVW